MDHPLRDYTRAEFGKFLVSGPLTRNCERNVLNWTVKRMSGAASWENRIFRETYKMKVQWLLAEFKRNPELSSRLKSKELESTKLASYTADVLNPNGKCAQTINSIKEKSDRAEEIKRRIKAAEDANYVGQFKCGKCKSVKTTYYQLQTRSADEPMVRLMDFFSIFSNSSADNLRQLFELWG